jgi:Glu-tRNA(Gln) amidotransferase subunit E-like FAD-binding protein
MDYKKLGLKVGLEIHFQLDVAHKLFCKCSTAMAQKQPTMLVERKLHPVPSELGEVDVAAQFEYLRDRTFVYQVFDEEVCNVELDEEPPHPVNQEALKVALQVALLFNCDIPDEIHIMRKTVIDGSNPSGFQRTMVVGRDGFLMYKGKKVPITYVSLEEDAGAKVAEEDGKVVYRLSRLGIPLIEVDTGILEGFTPEDVNEIAYTIGLIVRSTGKVKRVIGAIRQDVNVSIEKGARVEIKGIQSLGLIARTIEEEVKRQIALVEKGQTVKEETRFAKTDGSTEFMRPLPGANRMYPESDLPPIPVGAILKEAKKSLPESLEEKIKRYKTEYKLSEELVSGLLKSDYFFTFENFCKQLKLEPRIVANVLASVAKDLKRRGLEVAEDDIFAVLQALNQKKIVKEAVPDVLEYLARHGKTVEDAIKELGIAMLQEDQIKEIVKEALKSAKDFESVLKLVMSKVRGKADVQTVIRIIKGML